MELLTSGAPPRWRVRARFFARGMVFRLEQARRDSHVAREGRCALLEHRWLLRLPSKTSERGLVPFHVPNDVRAAGNPVDIAIVRIFELVDDGLWDGFEQANTDHLRRDARRDAELRCRFPVSEMSKVIARSP